MYIRWKKRSRKSKEIVVLSAFLVESKRVNGKPRQQTILPLGSIQKPTDPLSLEFFWRELEQKMAIADLHPSIRDMIRARVTLVVPLLEQVPA